MKNKLFQIMLLGITILLVIKGSEALSYAKEALVLCYNLIIPSLFPFFICSGLLIYSGFCESLAKIFKPVMTPLFNINKNGSAAFVLGIISGYPQGAITVCRLYEANYLSKTEAERMMAFCNNSGPLFILGSVGIGLYVNPKAGIMMYAAHVIAAFLVGIIFRFYKKDEYRAYEAQVSVNKEQAGFSYIVEDSVRSILNICACVVFFSVVSRICLDFVPMNELLEAVAYGVCEFTMGVFKISRLSLTLFEKLILSSFIIGFAGFSVHIQVMSIVLKHGLSLMPYIVGKFLHGVLSATFMWAVLWLFEGDIKFTAMTLNTGFMISAGGLIAIALILFLVSFLKGKSKIIELSNQ